MPSDKISNIWVVTLMTFIWKAFMQNFTPYSFKTGRGAWAGRRADDIFIPNWSSLFAQVQFTIVIFLTILCSLMEDNICKK